MRCHKLHFCRKTGLNYVLVSSSDHLTTSACCCAFMIPQESQDDEQLPALNLLICLVARYLPQSSNSSYWSGHMMLYISGLHVCNSSHFLSSVLQILWAEWSCRSARVNSRNRYQQDAEEEYVVNSQQETYWRWRLLSSRVKSKEGGFPTVHTTMAEALVVLHVMVKVEDRTERTGSWTHNQVTK